MQLLITLGNIPCIIYIFLFVTTSVYIYHMIDIE